MKRKDTSRFVVRHTRTAFTRIWWPDLGQYEWLSDCGRMCAWGVVETVERMDRDTGELLDVLERVYRATVDGFQIGTFNSLKEAMVAAAGEARFARAE